MQVSQPSMAKVLQVNLNHCWAAQQLLAHTVLERGIDVVIVSDYYRGFDSNPCWIDSTDHKCGVLITDNCVWPVLGKGAGTGYAGAKVGDTVFYSCYCTPNCTLQDFDIFLDGVERSISNLAAGNAKLVVASDFNAHSAEWGSTSDDARGTLLSGFASTLGLLVCNVGTVPTFSRVNAASVIDVTFARSLSSMRTMVDNWKVLTELDSASDHLYVEYTVAFSSADMVGSPADRVTIASAWAVRKLSTVALEEFWRGSNGSLLSLPQSASAEEHAEHLNQFLVDSCEAAMPRRTVFKGRKAAHWWNNEIADLRRASIAARRRYQRAGRRQDIAGRATALAEYNEARKRLRLAIRKSQEDSWRELCNSVENDPWGVPFRLVTKKLGHRSPVMDNNTASTIARGLFPALQSVDWSEIPYITGDLTEILPEMDLEVIPFTEDELKLAVRKLSSGKAPGPDQVPNEIIKMAAIRFPGLFLAVFNACIRSGCFPARWKRASLVLLHKGQSKPPDQPSSYRPISLLDGAGKLLERLLMARLAVHINQVHGLSDAQYGFRRGRSTTDAISEVLRMAQAAGSGAVQNRDLCAVVMLDVKNAFNSAPWMLIDASLQRCNTPRYIVNVIRSYMCDRSLIIGRDPNLGAVRLPVTCGVPQGSVLGPALWNLFYDGVLRLQVPRTVKLLAFADDVAVVAVGHNADILEGLLNRTLSDVSSWMSRNGLTLSPEKSECVVLTNKRSYRSPEITVNGYVVPVKRTARYLGVHLDTRLSFVEHVRIVSDGAKAAATALGRLMPNVGGPSQSKRQLLMSVVHSRLLYGAQVWAEAISGVGRPKGLLLQAQRVAALRVARCYRSVSDEAALLLARMPPANLLAAERARSAAMRKIGTPLTKFELRSKVIRQWQIVWNTTTKASWTRRLLPDVAKWWYNGPKSVSYHMAQVLTGHGCFQKYLHSKARVRNPNCVHCDAADDDAEHTIFICQFWDQERQQLARSIGRTPRPDDVVDFLCSPSIEELPSGEQRVRLLATAARNSALFSGMVEAIMGKKEELERQRQRQEETS